MSQGDTELGSEIYLYDHDVLAIEAVIEKLNESRLRPTTVDGWRREIEERFAEAGFTVSVVLRQLEAVERPDGTLAKVTGTYIYNTITITGRVEKQGEFDHDLQRHEVQANIRNLDQPDAPKKKTSVSMATGPNVVRRDSGLYVPR